MFRQYLSLPMHSLPPRFALRLFRAFGSWRTQPCLVSFRLLLATMVFEMTYSICYIILFSDFDLGPLVNDFPVTIELMWNIEWADDHQEQRMRDGDVIPPC